MLRDKAGLHAIAYVAEAEVEAGRLNLALRYRLILRSADDASGDQLADLLRREHTLGAAAFGDTAKQFRKQARVAPHIGCRHGPLKLLIRLDDRRSRRCCGRG